MGIVGGRVKTKMYPSRNGSTEREGGRRLSKALAFSFSVDTLSRG